MPKLRLSLANKCQILFGAAVLLILIAALAVPWLRMQTLVTNGQREIARELADAWLADLIQLVGVLKTTPEPMIGADEQHPRRLRLVTAEEFDFEADDDAFFAESLARFESAPSMKDVMDTQHVDGVKVYRYARAVRQSDIERMSGGFVSSLATTQVSDPLRAVLLIDMHAAWAERQLTLNLVYTITAGLLALLLAIAVFWFITTRIILSPVRVLRETAEKVAEGDLNIRADINTGDEFEQLSDTFNSMLGTLKSSQDQLRDLNKQLDLKLGELAESNISLHEANRIKGDFLANVSHELRTPLNSIIGFAEVLDETLHAAGAVGEKQRRYLQNITSSSRSLLQLINELLDLAKIEAGRVELHVEPMSVVDACETLLNLIRPQADAKKLTLKLAMARHIPMVETDPGKFQQVLFNFLSNAVKFTPEGGTVELGARPLLDDDTDEPVSVQVWVKDTGPGIPEDMHQSVFDKFRQVDAAHTKQHGGTGLGLAICKELSQLLGGRIDLDSSAGEGATFTLTIPLQIAERSEPLMPDLAD